jgi:hypothetical protein
LTGFFFVEGLVIIGYPLSKIIDGRIIMTIMAFSSAKNQASLQF